jgi:hypothetical protein
MARDDTHNLPRIEPATQRPAVVRMKVVRGTTRPDPDDPLAEPEVTDVYICHVFDGINEGTDEIPVKCEEGRKPGDIVFAFMPLGGTDATNPETATDPGDPSTELRVIWQELFAAQKKYWIKITGATAITGASNRWVYGWEKVRLVRGGTFAPPQIPDSSLLTGILAYNSVEANNSGGGIQGNSIDLALLPPGVNILPVQGGPVVRAWVETNCDGDAELIFQYENAITADCT